MACFLSTVRICGDPKDWRSGTIAKKQGRERKLEKLAARFGCNFAFTPVVGASGNDSFSVEMNQLHNRGRIIIIRLSEKVDHFTDASEGTEWIRDYFWHKFLFFFVME